MSEFIKSDFLPSQSSSVYFCLRCSYYTFSEEDMIQHIKLNGHDGFMEEKKVLILHKYKPKKTKGSKGGKDGKDSKSNS